MRELAGRIIFTDDELMRTFPESVSIIPLKIWELEQEKKELTELIAAKIRMAKSFDDEFDRLYWREVIKVFDNPKLIAAENNLKRLCRQRNFIYNIKQSGITDANIQQALEHPIQNLIPNQTRKCGKFLICCCPIHKEKTPSFFIYQGNTFYCFGCHIGGDSIALTELLYDYDFPKAVNFLNGGN